MNLRFKKDQFRKAMCSYAIKVPVVNRIFFMQYSDWVLDWVQHRHIANINYTQTTDNRIVKLR